MIAYDGAWKITSSSEQALPRGTTTTIVVCVVFRGIIASVSRTHISGRVSMCSSWSNFTAIVSFNSVIDAASIDPNFRIALPSLLTDFPAIHYHILIGTCIAPGTTRTLLVPTFLFCRFISHFSFTSCWHCGHEHEVNFSMNF